METLQEQYELLKFVDKKDEYLVYGFVHVMEKLRSGVNIPIEIIKLCLLFFFNRECFEAASDAIEISGQNRDIITKLATSTKDVDNIAYGSNWIPSTNKSIYKWTVHIVDNNKHANNGIIVGVIADIPDSANMNRSFYNNPSENMCPCYANWGGYLRHNGKGARNVGHSFGRAGQIVIFELNLIKGTLDYYIDGELQGKAVDVIQNESTRYKFAISMYWPKTQIKLVKFECDSG